MMNVNQWNRIIIDGKPFPGRSSAERLEYARELFVQSFPRLNALRFVRGMVIPCRVRQCKGKRT
jgi:hypothetical protein